MEMTKKEIFFQYAWLPEDDGTFVDCYDYYMKHPQKDPEILKRTCIELSLHCHFCMSVVEFFWSPSRQDYFQAYSIHFGIEDLDFTKFKYEFREGISVTHEDDLATVPYENIEGHIAMMKIGPSYNDTLRALMRGETFLQPKPSWRRYAKKKEEEK